MHHEIMMPFDQRVELVAKRLASDRKLRQICKLNQKLIEPISPFARPEYLNAHPTRWDIRRAMNSVLYQEQCLAQAFDIFRSSSRVGCLTFLRNAPDTQHFVMSYGDDFAYLEVDHAAQLVGLTDEQLAVVYGHDESGWTGKYVINGKRQLSQLFGKKNYLH